MSVRKRTPQRARLYEARKEALTELSHLRQELQGEVEFTVDEADELITEHETAAILVSMLEHKVHDIENALTAIDTGQYDNCERCGQPIDLERLRAKPDARLCIACQ